MDWDDLRIFLHLARTGRMSGAGRALGIDDTTVGRRVARLEQEVGAPLVARAGRRTVITEQGQRLAQAAEEMEAVVLRKISGLGEAALSRLASMSTSSEKMPLCISVNAMLEPTKPQPMTAAF